MSASIPGRGLPWKAYESASDYDRRYGSCAQCVVLGISETLNLEMDDVVKAGHPLAGGAALSGYGACGALSGGLMSLGFLFGRSVDELKAGKDASVPPHKVKSYRLGKQLYDRFVRKYGGPRCVDAQKKAIGRSFKLWAPEERKKFFEAGGRAEKCPDIIGNVAKWVVEIQLRESKKHP